MENEIFKSLLYIVNFFNNPQNDNFLLKEAGIKNDPNLLPIIVRIGAASSISVGELASQLGKNHSSTSRQVDKFERQGLLVTTPNSNDKRIRNITLSPKGNDIFQLITKTRQEVIAQSLSSLTSDDINTVNAGLAKLAKVLKNIDMNSYKQKRD